MLIIPKTRLLGALAGLGVLVGAIGFHISPWLGINVPGMGHSLFIMALAMLALTIWLILTLRKAGYGLFGPSIN